MVVEKLVKESMPNKGKRNNPMAGTNKSERRALALKPKYNIQPPPRIAIAIM